MNKLFNFKFKIDKNLLIAYCEKYSNNKNINFKKELINELFTIINTSFIYKLIDVEKDDLIKTIKNLPEKKQKELKEVIVFLNEKFQ